MFNRLFPSTFGRKKLAKFAKNIAQGKNVTQIFGNRWESSNMQATVYRQNKNNTAQSRLHALWTWCVHGVLYLKYLLCGKINA